MQENEFIQVVIETLQAYEKKGYQVKEIIQDLKKIKSDSK